MKKCLKRIAIAMTVVLTALFSVNPALAREDYFRPASGDVTSFYPGNEKAAVTAEGALNVFNEKGVMITGFPLTMTGETFVSSPLLADITGTVEKEIVVITRNADSAYFLKAFNSGKTLLASFALGEAVYFDPAELRVPNLSKKDIIVATVAGKIYSFRFASNNFTQTLITDAGKPAGVSASASGSEIIVNFPAENQLKVFSRSSNSWTETKTVSLSKAFVYPVLYGATDTIYGLTADKELVAVSKNTGDVITGFPKNLSAMAIDTPYFTDIDSTHAGTEMVVPLSNGKNDIFDAEGNVLADKSAQKSFVEDSGTVANQNNSGIFSAIGNYGSVVRDSIYENAKSVWSLLNRQATAVSSNASMTMEASGSKILNGSAYDFGEVFSTIGKPVEFTIGNSGDGSLQLTGDDLVIITGANADQFSVTAYPDSTIANGGNTKFSLLFMPTSAGMKTAQVTIASNASDANPFVMTLSGKAYAAPVVYEDAENGNTSGWSLYYPATVNATITNVADEDAAHGRAIQLTQTATGANYFRLRKDDQTEWNNTTGKIFKFDLKTSEETLIYVYVATNKGARRVLYSFNRDANKYTGTDSEINLNPAFKDGQWHAITRNLEQDLKKLDNELVLTKVNYLLVGALPVGKSVRFDNIMLVPDAGYLHMISGTVADASGQPVPGYKIGFMPENISEKTNTAGKFIFTSLPAGSYSIQSQTIQYEFDPKVQTVTVDTADVSNLNLTANLQETLVYEDAEDTTTNGWSLYYPATLNGTIANVSDDEAHGRVIQLTTTAAGTNYFKLANDNGTVWDNGVSKTLKWDLKTSDETVMYVYVTTNKGARRVVYSFNRDANKYTGNDAEINLNTAFKDGQWHTITRNLEQDLRKLDNDLVLTKVNNLLFGPIPVGKSIKLDNIMLVSGAGSLHTLSGKVLNADGAPVPGFKIMLKPENIVQLTNPGGKFMFTSLSAGTYSMQSQTVQYEFDPKVKEVSVDATDITDFNLTANLQAAVVYEDGEDGTTNGWSLYYPNWVYGTMENVDDDAEHGKVIKLTQTVNGSTYYRLRKDDQTEWKNNVSKIFRWDMKTTDETLIYMYLTTNKGSRRVVYSFNLDYASYNTTDAVIHLNPVFKDGNWHTITRNLEQDLKRLDPELTLTQVNYLMIGSLKFGKSAYFDNIALLSGQTELYSITGIITDSSTGTPIEGLNVQLMPENIFQKTSASGRVYFSGLAAGDYTLRSDEMQIDFSPVSAPVRIESQDVSVNLPAVVQDSVVIEDGEDGTTTGWSLYAPLSLNSTVTNVVDDDQAHGNAIQLSTVASGTNYFYLKQATGNTWENRTGKVLQWDMKTTEYATIYVHVSTNKGFRVAVYSFNLNPNLVSGGNVNFNLNPAFKDGSWHTITRNIEQDLKKFDNTLTLTKINYLFFGALPVGKNCRIDNVIVSKDHNALHSMNGALTDSTGVPFANQKLYLMPDNISVTTNASGQFSFTSLPDGVYNLKTESPHYPIVSGGQVTISGADAYSVNPVSAYVNAVTYEDAEDGLTNGWSLYYPQYQNSTIANVSDDDQSHGRVIELLQTVAGSQIFKFANDNGGEWTNPHGRILSWDMKTSNEIMLYAYLNTNKGAKRALYSYTRTPSYNGADAYFNIGAELKDGQWHSFVRDLDADMKSVDPTISVLNLKYILFSSPGVNKPARLDNIRIQVTQ